MVFCLYLFHCMWASEVFHNIPHIHCHCSLLPCTSRPLPGGRCLHHAVLVPSAVSLNNPHIYYRLSPRTSRPVPGGRSLHHAAPAAGMQPDRELGHPCTACGRPSGCPSCQVLFYASRPHGTSHAGTHTGMCLCGKGGGGGYKGCGGVHVYLHPQVFAQLILRAAPTGTKPSVFMQVRR
jgi:hypothetical protein